jgi:ERCC4-related helicase
LRSKDDSNFDSGIAETYKFQPNNPVDFLAKWLLNYNMASVTEDQMKDLAKHAEEKKVEHEKKMKDVESKKLEKEKFSKTKEARIESFNKMFHSSDDLEDQLQELSDFLCVSGQSYFIGTNRSNHCLYWQAD